MNLCDATKEEEKPLVLMCYLVKKGTVAAFVRFPLQMQNLVDIKKNLTNLQLRHFH